MKRLAVLLMCMVIFLLGAALGICNYATKNDSFAYFVAVAFMIIGGTCICLSPDDPEYLAMLEELEEECEEEYG